MFLRHVLPCKSEHGECERYKGDEGNVIGHEHTAEKAEHDEDGDELAHTADLGKHPLCKSAEHADFLQACHDCHQAEQQTGI